MDLNHCNHQVDGWCLACVRNLLEENAAIRGERDKLYPAMPFPIHQAEVMARDIIQLDRTTPAGPWSDVSYAPGSSTLDGSEPPEPAVVFQGKEWDGGNPIVFYAGGDLDERDQDAAVKWAARLRQDGLTMAEAILSLADMLRRERERNVARPHLFMKDLCETLGWQGGTIHAVIEEVHRLKTKSVQLEHLRNLVRYVRDQRGDNKCWRDLDMVYAALPEGYTPPVRDTLVTLENCRRYVESCHDPRVDYHSPERRIEELTAFVSFLANLGCMISHESYVPGTTCRDVRQYAINAPDRFEETHRNNIVNGGHLCVACRSADLVEGWTVPQPVTTEAKTKRIGDLEAENARLRQRVASLEGFYKTKNSDMRQGNEDITGTVSG